LPPPPLWSQHPDSKTAAERRPCRPQKTSHLHVLACNLATFLRCIELPEAMAD
jgi:hypothetical protein